jgi:hypothetical protein
MDCVTVLYRMSESKKEWRCDGAGWGLYSYLSMHVNLRRIFPCQSTIQNMLHVASCHVKIKTT